MNVMNFFQLHEEPFQICNLFTYNYCTEYGFVVILVFLFSNHCLQFFIVS